MLSPGNLRDYGLWLEPNIDAPIPLETPDDKDVSVERDVPVEEHDPYQASGTSPFSPPWAILLHYLLILTWCAFVFCSESEPEEHP